MNNRSGLSFADVLIILAVVLLLAALAVPKFIKATDYGTEEDELATSATNDAATAVATNIAEQPLLRKETPPQPLQPAP